MTDLLVDPAFESEQAEVAYPPGLIPPSQRRRSNAPIGHVIVQLGFARREAVQAAVALSREVGKTTGQLLLEAGELRSDQLARALAERFGVDYADLSVFEIDSEALRLIDGDTARRYQTVPIGFLPDGTVALAMADPTNVLTIDEIAMISGRQMRPVAVASEDLAALLVRYTRLDEPSAEPTPEPDTVEVQLNTGPSADAPAVKLVHQLIAHAVHRGASDIHLDPEAGELTVQLRVDGVLTPMTSVPRSMAASVISRIKIMAGLNIAERRMPQDGRLRLEVDRRHIDVRVASLPLIGGEGVVLRILDTGAVVRDLGSLGMQAADRERFAATLAKPYGAALVTGPTGSGKSTTLYGGLSMINDGERSILTIEDPVESPIPGIKQMQVAVKGGLTFAAGLRSILRADPDVIMVGEIRDRETAEIAIQSALTGHLMLSTLHTRDAASAITRLVDMGIEPFMISAALDCVVAQRLARQLCSACKQPTTMPPELLAEHGLDGGDVFDPRGCGRCGGTGYTGRVGLYEVMPVNDEIRSLVLARVGVDELAAAAVRAGMRTMRDDGLDKVRRGMTSLVEIGRVTTRG